jgi:hypothetical protein
MAAFHFQIQNLRRAPEQVVPFFDQVRRIAKPVEELPVIEIDSPSHIAPIEPEVVKLGHGFDRIRQKVEAIQEQAQ